MRFRKPEPQLDHTRLLDAVPRRNDAVRVEPRGAGLLLWVPLQRRWWTRGVFEWLLPLRKEKGIELDALGREVWEACDGQTTLEAIVESFAQHHRLRFHEARLSVGAFLALLLERRLMVMEVPSEALLAAQPHGGGKGVVSTS
jgi:hydroxyacyl-ACP dehydratase HTD2-like protein with hotdog domain